MVDPFVEGRYDSTQSGAVQITYYTDPLCCWSWALEPKWKRLRYEFEGSFTWQYKMAGLITDWDFYQDPMNAIARPQQMGPLWMQAEQVSGMPIQSKIWVDNPPASSYPACLALKCVELQSFEAGEIYLRMLREAVMLDGQNIADIRVLTALAEDLAQKQHEIFDLATFESDWSSDKGVVALKQDILDVKRNSISRFPSFVFEGADKRSVLLSGYQPYSAFVSALMAVAPGILPSRDAHDLQKYREYWPQLIDRELDELLS